MLRNLKVGTKLFVILLAPMVVIVALVGVGARDRRDASNAASRVEDLSSFALAGNDLQVQVAAEELYTAVVASSNNTAGRAELDEQRTKTDAAIDRYQSALTSLDQGDPKGSLAGSIGLVRSRVSQIKSNRLSLDNSSPQAYQIIEPYGDVISALVGVNATLAGEADQSDLLRGLDGMSRTEQLRAAMVDQAALLVGAAQKGAFTDRDGVVCADVAAAGCETYARAERAAQGYDRAEESLSLSGATPQQRQNVVSAAGLSTYLSMATDLMQQGAGDPANGVAGNRLTISGADAVTASTAALDGISKVDTEMTEQIVDGARSQEQTASRSMLLYLLFGAAGLAIAFAIAVVVARSITGPLSKLTKAAGTLSKEQLPALVQQLRNPEDEAVEAVAESLTPIEVDSHDEIGDLAAAFNSIQAVTVDVAEEQGRLLRKGIGEIFVNLARRNQSLLDRQIEFIDHLESTERDPDTLDNLFKLDHLATRMRRNAESLLVMAGADPPRRRGAPVPVSDVVRVAIGEVEDYQRVHLLALDDATVATNVASDLAHLLSELMENATNASPPNTSVEVLGGYDARNGYVITVADRGIGMSEDQLADANHHLAHPPMVGLVISRSLGLTVVGRLASRYALSVHLEAREDGGMIATVALPYGLVEYPGEDAEAAPSAIEVMAAAGGRPSRPRRAPRPAAVSVSAGGPANGAVVAEPDDRPLVSTPAGLPRRRDDEPNESPAPTTEPVALATAPTVTEVPARPAEPEAPTVTSAGLVKRTPAARSTTPADAAPSRAVTRTTRSPEEVRRMLSRYRSGLDRGRTIEPGAAGEPESPESPTQGPEE